ncbi:MAG: glyoxalase [Gammaproteobacteria bacterium RIFCSPHIGHO2_12_FULL_35_23]|nr:MAG: glyoxalase [Gammaproteobacteria bacterium RIFCSPHIGHO2_12_FULL_35_23]
MNNQTEILQINHVQITVSRDQEQAALQFYCEFLGMKQIAKPPVLAGRGGFWLQLAGLQIHIGLEDHVNRYQTKAHIAYEVKNLEAWRTKLINHGIEITASIPIPGRNRFEFRDPFGNRVEFIEMKDAHP